MKTVVAALAFAIVASHASAGAQAAEDMRISISAYLTRPAGGEEPAGVSFVSSLTDKTSSGAVFRPSAARSLSAGMEGAFQDRFGWRVELPPFASPAR